MSEQKTKTPRWQKGLLVASLAMNLAVIGAVAGMAIKGGPDIRRAQYDLTVGPFTRAMEPRDRDAVRTALRNSEAFRPSDRTAIRMDMQALIDVLRAEQFDKNALRDAITRQRARLAVGQDAVLDAVTAQIDAMSTANRVAFADRLEEQLRRGPPARDR